VSLERSLEGLSNGEGNLDLAYLGTKLWEFEIFPTWEGIGQTEQNWTKSTFFWVGLAKRKFFALLNVSHILNPLGASPGRNFDTFWEFSISPGSFGFGDGYRDMI
jgi:hypothetical protein